MELRNFSGGGGGGVDSLNGLTGDVILAPGTNITLVPVGNTITINASGGGTVGPGTTNEIAYFDSPTTVTSLTTATYPSLTELSYVKGVTSAIQTQLNGKLGSALLSGLIFVGSAGNVATGVSMSGDATIINTGALTLATVNSNVGSFTNASITVNAKGLITAASSGTAPVTSVSGTANRITSTGGATPVIDISASYVGQSSITTVGTLSAGAVPASLVTAGTFGTGAYTFPSTLVTTTSETVPLVIGGTAVGSSLSLQSTSGVGTTDFIRFLVGNNGGTEAMRILDSGYVGIGTATATSLLSVVSSANLPIVVTGTLSPAAGGTFIYDGVYNSSPSWALGSYFIWFRSGFDQWIMSTAKGTVSGNFWFVVSANQLLPPGTGGWTAAGAATGTPLLTVGTTTNITSSGIGNVIVNTNGYFGIGTNTPNYPLHVLQNTDKTSFTTVAAFSINSASSGFMDTFRFAAGANGSRGGAMYFGETGGGTTFSQTAEQILAGLNSFGFVQEGNFPIYFMTNNNQQLTLSGSGNLGIGTANTSPTARLHLPAGTSTANTAPLKFTSGTSLTTAETGAVEYDGTNLFFTPTGTIRKTIPTIVMGRQTGQTAADASVVTHTVGSADASYEVSANILVTTSSAENFTTTVAYTDEGNTARTLTLNFQTIAGVIGTAINFANGAVPYEGIVTHIRCKASTTITVATTGTFTGATYNVEGQIKLLK